MKFESHNKPPKKAPMPKRGGVFVDAVRLLIDDPKRTKSISFAITPKYTAVVLRNRLGVAGRHCGVRIATTTADGRVYAEIRKD